jgi:hypothetical protein
MSNAQQNLDNNAKHQFGDGKEMTLSQKIDFIKTQEQMSNEIKQTTVEWLENQLKLRPSDWIEVHPYFEQAKEMEKEKNEKFNKFLNFEKQLGISDLKTIERIQRLYNTYFNETYGGNK